MLFRYINPLDLPAEVQEVEMAKLLAKLEVFRKASNTKCDLRRELGLGRIKTHKTPEEMEARAKEVRIVPSLSMPGRRVVSQVAKKQKAKGDARQQQTVEMLSGLEDSMDLLGDLLPDLKLVLSSSS